VRLAIKWLLLISVVLPLLGRGRQEGKASPRLLQTTRGHCLQGQGSLAGEGSACSSGFSLSWQSNYLLNCDPVSKASARRLLVGHHVRMFWEELKDAQRREVGQKQGKQRKTWLRRQLGLMPQGGWGCRAGPEVWLGRVCQWTWQKLFGWRVIASEGCPLK